MKQLLQSAKYKTSEFKFIKIGKMVFGFGLMKPSENWSGGASTTIGLLPVGFRPKMTISAISWSTNINNHLRYQIATHGGISVYVYGSSPMFDGTEASITFVYEVA